MAPNGARKTRQDHPALPITIGQIVESAKLCFQAGAHGLHAHVRDREGKHVLDAGLFLELIAEMRAKVPGMKVQITTEAAGRYSPREQRELVEKVKPDMVCVAMREMFEDDDLARVSRFYYSTLEQGTKVQHIVYTPDEFYKLSRMIMLGTLPPRQKSVLFVLGRYSDHQQGKPDMLVPFLDILQGLRLKDSWRFMTCAFGQNEIDCLLASARAGGDCRVGFENNILNADGQIARDNSQRVAALISALKGENLLT